MDRDRRLTGTLRGQTDNVVAPPGFELSSAWRVCCQLEGHISRKHADVQLAGGTILLGRDHRGWSLASNADASTMQPLLPPTISKILESPYVTVATLNP